MATPYGVAMAPGKWKWSSFQVWETDIDDPIPIDRDNVPLIEKLKIMAIGFAADHATCRVAGFFPCEEWT